MALRSQVATLKTEANLKSQFATSSFSHGGRRKLPIAFSEHGALMAAGILPNSAACSTLAAGAE
jgi:hypothetical protein